MVLTFAVFCSHQVAARRELFNGAADRGQRSFLTLREVAEFVIAHIERNNTDMVATNLSVFSLSYRGEGEHQQIVKEIRPFFLI